ncbi:hypothetical protein [Ovoidimarina sediminis]|nr:hypothetical protein [Rhodophyticola sp. MJ-SS7]
MADPGAAALAAAAEAATTIAVAEAGAGPVETARRSLKSTRS